MKTPVSDVCSTPVVSVSVYLFTQMLKKTSLDMKVQGKFYFNAETGFSSKEETEQF
jgi:hypothetical protein